MTQYSLPLSEICQEIISSCGLVISILGSFYGTVDPEIKSSYAEYELEITKQQNNKIICFIVEDSNCLVPVRFIREQRLLHERLESLHTQCRERQNTNFTIIEISTLDEFIEALDFSLCADCAENPIILPNNAVQR